MPPEGKSDMERVGLFKEMGYISVGDKYTPFTYRPFNESAQKDKQMLTGGAKTKSALQAGYFDPQFKRIFEREALTDPVKLQRQHRMQEAKKNLGKAFLPGGGEAKPCGIGSYYGTLGGPVEALSAQLVPRKPHKSPGKNLYTSPSKKGSGYGYPNVTLSRPDPYSSDPFDRAKDLHRRETVNHKSKLKGGPFRLNLHPKEYFDTNPYKLDKLLPPEKEKRAKGHFTVPFKPSSPGKRTGGMKSGTFDAYPAHSADPYVPRKAKPAVKDVKVFRPCPGPKSTPVKSILSVNASKMVNSVNYTTIPSVMAY
ncbi:cilia-and flagella-associated protein 96 isoform X2 [Denticeps clupeoides]|uniref:Cilia-and flagella-associated protein 96 n=1 Tax=Denticeps clupeoides TaxID=299321 RepID=A0AAY4B311_9TELE|nr:UPF0602 protein C4orf47 homolog isoform X2 [Denticeps clupeoides]